MTDTLDRLALLARLADRIEQFTTTDGWMSWLAVAARFRTYSLNNQLLIAMQRPDATYVAGYRTWQSFGRQVKKGEKGIRIFAPVIQRRTAEVADEPGTTRPVIGFRAVTVFDIAQTDGEPLPDIAMQEVITPDAALFDRIKAAAERTGLTVELTPDAEKDVRGWWMAATKTIYISDRETVGNRTRTILHELAHSIDLPDVEALTYGGSRSVKELVAESAAYIVGTGVFGLQMDGASITYAATWGATRERLIDLATRVLDVASDLERMLSDCLGKPV